MVAIVAGNGLGLFNTSVNVIGEAGVAGDSALGQGAGRLFVNAATGNLVLQMEDAHLSGRGWDLFATRTYNSLGATTDSDGDGWRWGYEQTVTFQGPGAPQQPGSGTTVVRTDGDGHETAYLWDAARTAYVATEGSGAHDELRYDAAASEWVWTDGTLRVTERYSNSTAPGMTGRLIRCTDASDNSIVLAYSGGRLTRIRDTGSQQELRLTYGQFSGFTRAERLEAQALADDAGGHATSTLANPRPLVEYDYDGQGRLITVTRRLAVNGGTGGDSFVTSYDYDAASARIAGLRQSDGTGVSFTYDADGRVSTVKDRNGTQATQLAITYGPQPDRTVITDGNGKAWTYRHDALTGQLTEVMTPPVGNAGLSTKFRYDDAGNLGRVIDPQNNAVVFGYDAKGNRALERDAVGNTTTRTFSPLNQIVTETRYRVADPDGGGPLKPGDGATTRYVYDTNTRLRFMVSAEGRVTENRYGSPSAGYGLLTQTLFYIGQLYDVSALGPTRQLTEAELEAWVAGLADSTQVQLTEYSYDLRGNMSQQTSLATVGAAGGGIVDAQADVTEYVYDAYSRLRQRIAVRGSARDRRAVVNSLTYDGLGRVLTTSGANGLQTIVYDDANKRITVTTASGLVETRDHDSRGRLVRVSLAGDGTTRHTRYVYDNADRPRMVEDALGGRRYRFYDAAGRLEFTVDATGAVTRFEHNPAGQLVRQTQFLNRANTDTWYDSAGGTVTKVALTVGAGGSDVVIDGAHDRVASFGYDEAGRLTASTDAAGTTTTITYDGLSRVVMTQTGDRVTRYLYDKDGRRVGMVDARGYLTEYRYDAGGRLVETVRYSHRSAAAPNMAAPVWVGVTQQIVVGGQPFSYRLPAYDADGDSLALSVVGAVPGWLSFDPVISTLSGTPPTTAGTHSITLRADDGRGRTSDITVGFTVVAAAAATGGGDGGPVWAPLSPLEILAGTAVSHVVPAATGSSVTYSVVGGLPPGLTFNPATRVLTGTCNAVGCYSIVLRATRTGQRYTDRTLAVLVRSATITPLQPVGSDQLADWRPADTNGLHSYLFYDGRARVIGAVDEQQFLTETVYDDALNTQRTLRYLTPVTVAPGDALASLKSRAGTTRQLSLIRFDDFGRVHELTALDGSTITRNEYDAAGRLTRVVAAADTAEERARRTFYNAFGEVVATLGGEGDAFLGASATPQRIDEAIRDYGTRYEYDVLGRRVRTIDANRNRTLFYFDAESRPTHSIGVIGQSADNSLAGEVSETVYDSFGQPRSTRRYAARLGDADMDQLLAGGGGGRADQGLIAKLAALADGARDQVDTYEYDRAGRLVRQVDAEGGLTDNIYNAYGDLAAQRRSVGEGRTTARQLDYDLLGRVVLESADVGGINSNARTVYDAFGRVVRTIDAAGQRTTTAYPDGGRSTVVTDPLLRATRTDHDALGRAIRVTNALGQQTTYAYDDAARSATTTTPEGRQVTSVHTRHGEAASITDARGNVVRYAYNRDGQPTRVTDALGRAAAQTAYDKSGRRLKVTDARGTVTRFAYDQRNRMVEQRIDPAGLNLKTQVTFDALGRQVAVMEGAGTAAARVTAYGYDRRGRTTTVVVDANGLRLSTTYSYDGLDNVVAVARGTPAKPDQHVVLYECDNLGRRITEIAAPRTVFGTGAPGSRDITTRYRYDADGRVTRRIDADGFSTWQVYDAAGQVTHVINALGEVSESRFDAAGRLVYSVRYLRRLSGSDIAAFGDVVGTLAPPATTSNDRRSYVVYDGDGQPRFNLDAAGSAGWVVTENRLDASGNVVEVRAYDRFLPNTRVGELDSAASPGITVAEIRSALDALGYRDNDPTTLSGVQRTFSAWDANNRQRFTLDQTGAVAERVYDAAGSVTARVLFAVRPTLANHDEATIDGAVDRNHSDNRVTRYVYDAAGRLRYTIDALGSVSGNEYDARGNVVTTLRWAARPALTQYTETAVTTALSALSAANDEVIRLVYDAADRLRFTVDATGAVNENAHGGVGNLLATTRFARRPALASFTEAALAAAVAPFRNDVENQVNRFAYDPDKRVRFAVDALGSIVESAYDGRGNLVSTTAFAARPVVAAVDEAALMAAVASLRADPRNRVSRFAYDAAARLRFSVDGLGSVSERVYDGAGALTGSVRFAFRPSLSQYSEGAINAAVTPHDDDPGNRLEYQLYDALGRLRFSVLRVSLEGGQPRYRIGAQELNALGQTVAATTYATAVSLPTISQAAIAAEVGTGDPARDRITRFVFDIAGRPIFRLQAVSLAAGASTYRVSAQRFDTFGQAIGSTDFATPVTLNAIDKAAVDAAVQAAADPARDRVTAVVYDALGQSVYSVLALGPDTYQATKLDYDALGRLAGTTQYASPAGPLATFDRAAIEAAANAIASAKDRRTEHAYDAAGRKRFELQADKAGAWTVGETRYDALGNAIEMRRYDRFVDDAWIAGLDASRPLGVREADVSAKLAALGYSDTVPASLAKIQRTRFAYDGQNRVRFTVDALGSVAENVYDALGDLVTTVRFGKRPVPARYTEGAIDAAVDRADAANRVQHSVFDVMGQLRFNVQVVEPNTASAGKHWLNERRYDALGQLVECRAYASPVGHLASYDEATVAPAIVVDAVNDRRSVAAYDAGGRQVFSLRELRVGSADRYLVVREVHDALGQVVQRTEYASPVALPQFDAASVESAVVVQPANDRTTSYVRDAAGRLRFEVNPDLSFREYTCDALDQSTETRLFDFRLPSHAARTEAEMASLRASRAVGDGVTRGQKQVWDAAGRLLRTVDALGNIERHAYDALGGRTQWIDRNRNIFAWAYDRRGRKSSEATPALKFKLRGEAPDTDAPDRRIETRFTYDAFGNLVRRIEAANFATDAATTDFTFDTVGRPVGTLYPGYYDTVSGMVERDAGPNRFRLEASITYDAMGNAVRVGDRVSASDFTYTWRTYDSQGQVVHEVNPLNNVTRYACNAFGERETVTRYSVTISGTPQNGVYWTADEVDPQLNWGLDEGGNVLEDVYARTIRLAYDKIGRKSSVTMPTATYYSTQMPGDAGQANYFRLSPALVYGVEDAPVTRYEYNAFGDVILQRVRANTVVEWQGTTLTHDVMGRTIRSVDAAGYVTAVSYDIAGNFVRLEERTGQPDGSDRITSFAYNLLDQQVRVDRYGLRYTDAGGVEHGVATWTWENGGEWLDPDADVATTVRVATYDPYGRPLDVTDGLGNVTSTRYNPLGQLVQITAPARVVAPLDANGEDAVDPFRNQVTERLVTSMTLDVFGRSVRQVRATTAGGDARETLQTYDAVGNLVSTTDAEGNVKRRASDAQGRVIRETQVIQADLGPLGVNSQGLERRYAYDALGQLTDTLDVYLDGSDPVQSGKSAVYNAFGEVVEERRRWGAADKAPAALNTARTTWFHYDNAGHVFEKVSADGLTLYYYNLLGQVTREEKRGNSNPTDGTGTRVTEIQYDVIGRLLMVRQPAFDADVTPGTGTTVRPVTPYSSRTLDRWGNVTGTDEGGYEVVNGQPSFAPNRIFRGYHHDDNNRAVTEMLGTHGFTSTAGVSTSALILKRILRDLQGNVVKEVDEARDPQTEVVFNSRTRRKQYDSAGRLMAEIDGGSVRIEYAYNIHGDRLATRNARGTVLFDRRDRNGNSRFRGVLRTMSASGPGEYNSFTGTGTIARTYLNAYLYDQAGRRFASKTFTEAADAPWSYTWFDGRNLGVRQRDAAGRVTACSYNPFGNKAVEIDAGGARTEWRAATTDYAVGRIDSYQHPGESGLKFGSYTYNDFAELTTHSYGNARTEYSRHKNGLVSQITIQQDVTQSATPELTNYQYDARGQMTMESRFDPFSIQTKLFSYDNQGRLSRVEDQAKAPDAPICDVTYAYDEWGNVRRIQATYRPTIADGVKSSDSWFAYDGAGRMTVSNGRLTGGAIALKMRTSGSVQIRYDNTGRRSGTTEYLRHDSASLPTMLRTWDTMREERYTYDDVGHLRSIEQRIRHTHITQSPNNGGDDVPMSDRTGDWQPLATRSANLRGDVTRAEQWTRISGTLHSLDVDRAPVRLGATTTAFHADGQVNWTKYDAADPNQSTETQNTYNALNGQLDSYLFKAFRSDGTPFSATFNYNHTFQNGQRVVRSIRDVFHGLDTTKAYDPLGRLRSERVDLPKPNGDGSDRYEERYYRYAADGRAFYKHTNLRLSASGPNTVPLPTPTTGEQTYVYAGERMAATVGAERLAGATKFDFAYTAMSEVSGSGASRYVVQSGDSLTAIALAVYGDGALWTVVADANSIVAEPDDPLPSTEVGKAYDVPEIIRSSRSATTFTSYGLSDIVGNDRPIAVPPPRPPRHSDIEILALAAASITVQVGVTVGLTALGVPAPLSAGIGAGLSNLAGQATSWGLGMQEPGHEGIDWSGIGTATVEGFVFSGFGRAGVLGREVWQEVKGGFDGWTTGSGPDWRGIGGSLFNVGFDALNPVLGGAKVGTFNFGLGSLINSAYNPSSGFAIPGSGRSPTVGAFEYAYSAVANGLAGIGYNWIRDRLEQPSQPPKPAGPRSVDAPRGRLPAELTDFWDEIDREYTEALDAAALFNRNQQIAKESNERLALLLQLNALQDRIDHFGEGIDDRAMINAAIRQNNADRVQREQAAAYARAAREARLRANAARLEAQMAKGPDLSLEQWANDMDELNNQIVLDLYANANVVRVTRDVNLDGLTIGDVSGTYDPSGIFQTPNARLELDRGVFKQMEREISEYRDVRYSDYGLVGLEIIVVQDVITSAEQARRLGLAEVQTFSQFKRSYARRHGSVRGVEQEFIKYHQRRAAEIDKNWDDIDRSYRVATFIAQKTWTAAQIIVSPASVIPLAVSTGTEQGLKLAGVDDKIAELAGGLAGIATGYGIGYKDPIGTIVPPALAAGTEQALKWAGVNKDSAAAIGEVTGVVAGLGISRAQARKAPSLRETLNAARGANAELQAARLKVLAAEFEMSKGIQVAEGVTLFKGVPAEARAARIADGSTRLLAPPSGPSSTQALALAGEVSPAAALQTAMPYLATGSRVPLGLPGPRLQLGSGSGRAANDGIPQPVAETTEFVRFPGQVTRDATPHEAAMFHYSRAINREVSLTEYNTGKLTVREGEPRSVAITSGPNVIGSTHTHPQSGVALFSEGDALAFAVPRSPFAPTARHSVVGLKWPIANELLKNWGLPAAPDVVTTTINQTTADYGPTQRVTISWPKR